MKSAYRCGSGAVHRPGNRRQETAVNDVGRQRRRQFRQTNLTAALPGSERECGHAFDGLFDERGNRGRLRDVDGMTALRFNNLQSGPLGHEVLGRRWDHAVFGGNHVPAGLRLPRRGADRAAESLETPRNLRVGHELGLVDVHVGGERLGEPRLVEK